MLHQAARDLLRRLEADEPPRALHLAHGVSNAALELEHDHLLAREVLEQVAKVLVVEAAPRRVAHRRQQHTVAPLLRHSVQPSDRRPVARHGIAQHDQKAGVGNGLSQERGGPEVREVAGCPFPGDLPGRAREKRRVLGRDALRGVALPEAIEVVDLLAQRRALDRRMAPHGVVPPARSAALRADPHVLRRRGDPPLGALRDLQRRVPGLEPIHETGRVPGANPSARGRAGR